jgi:formylglycine-generating enzyme required for sulfatase activity
VTISAGEDKTLDIRLKRKGPRYARAISNTLGMDFVYIKSGTFVMGSPIDEPRRDDDETQHTVKLAAGFYLQSTEVTVGQWRAFANATGYMTEAETEGGTYVWTGKKWGKDTAVYWDNPGLLQNDDHPVTCVSWNDAQKFAEWITLKEGKSYRLPTEAEWEYGCRAGRTAAFANGAMTEFKCGRDPKLDKIGWYCGNAEGNTHPVARKRPNTWGLYDMHGNVWEWCQDRCTWKGKVVTDTYHDGITDPLSQKGSRRVGRGGSWNDYAGGCRSANRFGSVPGYRCRFMGFRLVRTH